MAETKKLSPDPHGQAAFMLCEALMISFIEKGILSKEESSTIIDIVTDVKEDLSEEREKLVVRNESIRLLKELGVSLSAVDCKYFSLNKKSINL